MIRLMIGRDLKALYIPPARDRRAGRRSRWSTSRTATYPDNAVSLDRAARRDPRPGRPGRLRAHRTRARGLRHRPAASAARCALDGEPIASRTPREAIDRGIFLVPEDRKRAGLLLDLSIAQNISLPDLRAYARRMLVRDGAGARQRRAAEAQPRHPRARRRPPRSRTLSGGNQQKVVLAKWLSMQPQVIIFDEPTRGIDVGAKNEIYGLHARAGRTPASRS